MTKDFKRNGTLTEVKKGEKFDIEQLPSEPNTLVKVDRTV